MDGSVVLALRGVAFRLHRSRLVQQSPFLKKLFQSNGGKLMNTEAFPDGDPEIWAMANGTMDNTPLYVVEGVAPEDFEKLLNALGGSSRLSAIRVMKNMLTSDICRMYSSYKGRKVGRYSFLGH